MSYAEEFDEAVRDYWRVRAGQRRRQEERGVVDVGGRAEVTGGKQMLSLTELVAQIFRDEGLPENSIKLQGALRLPGYYRPTKQWDLLVVHEGILVAAVELKSIVSLKNKDSYGKNLNNRIEEAIGSAKDLRTAFREGIFGTAKPWLGYLFMIANDEQSQKERKTTRASEPFFPIDDEFRNASYQERAEVFCRRLMLEQLYDSACFVVSSKDPEAAVLQPAGDMAFSRFAASIKGHARYILELGEGA